MGHDAVVNGYVAVINVRVADCSGSRIRHISFKNRKFAADVDAYGTYKESLKS
jgi:hypothetical protein